MTGRNLQAMDGAAAWGGDVRLSRGASSILKLFHEPFGG
jgi:hypothetical protein